MKSANMFELKYDFSCELYRMSTYSAFPAGVPVSERSLARAGFYYTGVNDKVKCFCCGLMLDNWKQGDNPIEKHKKLYPSCSLTRCPLLLSGVKVLGPGALSLQTVTACLPLWEWEASSCFSIFSLDGAQVAACLPGNTHPVQPADPVLETNVSSPSSPNTPKTCFQLSPLYR